MFWFFKPDSIKSERSSQVVVVPTVFVHGFKGGPSSFNHMLDRFQENYHWGKKTMVCRVNKSGHLYISGGIPSYQKKNPFVQVIFENNRASIHDTTDWLKEIMEVLSLRYHVKEINVVGHSMGGLVLTNYIEQTYGQKNYPRIQKLITLGSPFKGIERESYYQNVYNTGPAVHDLKANSLLLRSLFVHRDQFDPHIQVLSIAGVVLDGELGDGVVSLDSALGLQDIVAKNHFHHEIIHDVQATHSGLHEHRKVDQLIGEFLWGIGKKLK